MLDTLKIVVGKRWPLMAALFVIEIAAIIVISSASFFPGELASTTKQYNNIKPVLNQSAIGQVVSIFANNVRVAIFELVPVVGPAVFGLSIYETARIVEVIGIINGPGVGTSLATLFILPSTWLELPAYSIAVAESVYLVYAMKRGLPWFVREVRFLIVNIGLIAGVLIVAATFEVSEIQFEQGPPQTQAYALLTWIPFAVVLAVATKFWKKARRDAPALEERDAAELAQNASAPPVLGEQSQPQPQAEKDPAGSPTSSSLKGEEGGATA
jgi:uncharacterized membrane protein SpoIIM required for sporulation